MTTAKLLKSYFLVNWKTTILGAVAAVEVYQATHSVQAAVACFFTGLVASDAKASHVPEKKSMVGTVGSNTMGIMVALIVGSFVLAAAPARADDATPAPAQHLTLFCMDAARTYCAHPGVGIAGTAYDFETRSIIKSVTVSGLLELTLGKSDFALLGGAGFQTGEVQGMPVQLGAEYLPLSVGVVFSETLFGTRPSRTVTGGYVVRF